MQWLTHWLNLKPSVEVTFDVRGLSAFRRGGGCPLTRRESWCVKRWPALVPFLLATQVLESLVLAKSSG